MPTRRELDRLIDRLEPVLARAFRESIKGMSARANLSALTAALQANDIDAALRAAGVSPAAMGELTEAIRRAYLEGGAIMAADVPKRLGFVFDLNNPAAQAWLANHSSNLVTRIVTEQREAIRGVLAAGFEQGRNPRSIALDIVGRLDSATKRRAGGIIGLTEQMAGYVQNARNDLENLDSRYFTRSRRDRRFDGLVQRAIDSSEPISQTKINQITGRYADRLLNLRGENIARTEAVGAINEGRDQALRQIVDEGLVPADAIQRVWRTAMDERTRESHAAANGQVVGLDEPFNVGGVQMMHPGDFGAPAGEIINCRCVAVEQVDWSQAA